MITQMDKRFRTTTAILGKEITSYALIIPRIDHRMTITEQIILIAFNLFISSITNKFRFVERNLRILHEISIKFRQKIRCCQSRAGRKTAAFHPQKRHEMRMGKAPRRRNAGGKHRGVRQRQVHAAWRNINSFFVYLSHKGKAYGRDSIF